MQKNQPVMDARTRVRKDMEGYRSLPEYILDSVGAIFNKLSSRSAQERKTFLPRDASSQENEGFPSFWLNGAAIAVFTYLIGWSVARILGQPFNAHEQTLAMWGAGNSALALIANKINIRAFLNTFRHSLLDKMLRVGDVEHLGRWLRGNFEIRTPLLAGLIVGPLLGWLLYNTWLENQIAADIAVEFHWGPFVTVVLASIQSVWVAFYLYPFYVAFPSQLDKYSFDLYTPDPSSSEVVGRLSRLLTYILYVTIAFIVQLTIGLSYVNVITTESAGPALIFSVFVWAPTVILYATGQYHLSDVIVRAKWKMLNQVQTKIERLYAGEKIPNRDTLEQLEKLMNYHDRIKSTPNSALNFRASLNFLNSLLLPILAFVATNIPGIVELIQGKPATPAP
jgi:hypothetical protein